MDFSQIIKLECCQIDFEAKDKLDALSNLAKLAKRSREFRDISEQHIFQALKAREELGSTGFSNGIAIPHCSIDGIKNFVISMAICKKGINFKALDNKRTKIFITIIGPKGKRNEHLKLLATVSQVLKEPNVVSELIKSSTKIALYEEFLRFGGLEKKAISQKGKEVLMILMVKNDDIMQEITEVFVEYGIQNSTIIETQNMENLLSNVPLFMGFFNFTGEKNPAGKIVLVKMTKDLINALVKGLEDVFGDLENFSALNLIVLDIFFSKGN